MQYDVFDAAQLYAKENTPLILIVGKDYGSGSSRDWAAKGPYLLVLQNIPLLYYYFFTSFLSTVTLFHPVAVYVC